MTSADGCGASEEFWVNSGKLLTKEYFILSDQSFSCLSGLHLTGLGGPGGLSRGEMSLAEVQCHLDKEGASDLVIDLIMNTTSDRVFQESILLAIALLEGGNTTIQVRKAALNPEQLHRCSQALSPSPAFT